MIILFGKKGCNKTHTEKKLLEANGISFKYFDVDTLGGREEIQKRKMNYNEVKKGVPWMFKE